MNLVKDVLENKKIEIRSRIGEEKRKYGFRVSAYKWNQSGI